MVERMLGRTIGSGMKVDSKEAVEASLDIEADCARSYLITMRDNLTSKPVQMAMHQ